MNKYDYFKQSLAGNYDYGREWMLRTFTVVLTPPAEVAPWMLRHTDKAVEVCVPGQGGWVWEVLEGCTPYEIPYIYHEVITGLKKGDFLNLDRDLAESTWGEVLYNHRVLSYAAGDRIPFRQPVNLKDDEQYILKRMMSDPPEADKDPQQIYVSHYIRFGKAIADLAGYEYYIPSLGESALTAPADNIELRNKLFEENKEQLDDPVIQVKIQKALVGNYVEKQLKGTPAEGFLYSNKSINTAIKRMLLIHGPEAGFSEGGRAELIPNSLSEGIDVKKYPAMVNSLRAGSFYRGALTALAGEDVDLFGRIFQNSKIVEGFCGTKATMGDIIDADYVGRSILLEGERILMTEENIKQYQGTFHQLFSPTECEMGNNDVCEVCIGQKLAPYKNSLGSMMGDMPSTMMALMMGSAHAKELKTTPLDLDDFLR